MGTERARSAKLLASAMRVVAVFVAIFATVVPARASVVVRWNDADTVFQNLAEDDELPNSASPYAMAQDAAGFLWIGSENGLERYDGYRFRLYAPGAPQTGSLLDGFVKALHVDPHGTLWVGTDSGGLARYDAARDRFDTFVAGRSGLSDNNVWALADDGRDLLVGTGAGLDRLDGASGRLAHVAFRGTVSALLRDRDGSLWAGTSHGLYRRRAGATAFARVDLPGPSGPPKVWSLAEDDAGRVWVGTTRFGAYVVDRRATRARAVATDRTSGSLGTAWITTIAAARPGEMWLGTNDRGIVAVDTATFATRRIHHDALLPATLPADGVRVVFRDRSGLLWVGTNRSLSLIDPRHTAVRTLFGEAGRRDGITDPAVNAVLVARDGRVWLGLGSHGVDILDPVRGRVGALRPDARHPLTALPNGVVNALVESAAGDVYLGTDRGLYRAERGSRRVVRLLIPHWLPEQPISALYVDGGTLWVGGSTGIATLALRHGVSPVANVATITRRLTDPRVRVFARGAGDDLWIGTQDGLNRVGLHSGEVERIRPDLADPHGLGGAFVSSLLFDGDRRLWVGTDGGGIAVLDRHRPGGPPRFRRIGTANGLPNDDIDAMMQARGGDVWVATDHGLAIVDRRTFALRTVGRPDGLDIGSYWNNSGARTSFGELLFGGLGGLTVVCPSAYRPWTYRPPVAFTDLRVAGHAVTGSFVSAPLVIAPDENAFSVEFASLDYSAPARNRYAYRLDGVDSTWIVTDAVHRSATYANLAPGRYTLHVRGSNRDGLVTEAPPLAIDVRPWWYQTLLFRIVEVGGVLLAIYFVVALRTRRLRERQRQLEAEVARQTAELRASHLRLEQFAYVDTLTNLPNRRMFGDEFAKLPARVARRNGRFALLLLDLDGFKAVNDTHGHDAGDAVLVETGRRLRAATRATDMVARLGGDEFAVLLYDANDEDGVEATCRRILEHFDADLPYKGTALRITPSIGAALYPDDGDTQGALYRSADLALYAAKRMGKNTWRLYANEMGD